MSGGTRNDYIYEICLHRAQPAVEDSVLAFLGKFLGTRSYDILVCAISVYVYVFIHPLPFIMRALQKHLNSEIKKTGQFSSSTTHPARERYIKMQVLFELPSRSLMSQRDIVFSLPYSEIIFG